MTMRVQRMRFIKLPLVWKMTRRRKLLFREVVRRRRRKIARIRVEVRRVRVKRKMFLEKKLVIM